MAGKKKKRPTAPPPPVRTSAPRAKVPAGTSPREQEREAARKAAARDSLRGVQTVIIDEVHAVAASKRGAHLAVSLERLDALLNHPAQRIGLSATVRPKSEVARFLAGAAPVQIVSPPALSQVNAPKVAFASNRSCRLLVWNMYVP